MKMIKFKLPEHAYKCEGSEVVAGHRFKDGELVVTEDQAKSMAPILIRFYGVTADTIEIEDEGSDHDPGDTSLEATVTKPGA